MSEPYDYGAEDDGNQANSDNVVTLRRSEIRSLQDKAKKFDAAEAARQQAERTVAFYQAGLDPNDPKTGYFVRGYQGEVTREKIVEAAKAAGFLAEAPEAGSGQEQQGESQQQGQEQGQQQGQGAPQETEEQRVQREALMAMAAATHTQGVPLTGGPQERMAAMQKALKAGGAEGLADWMRTQGLPVHEG